MRAEFRAFDKEVDSAILHREQFRKLRANLDATKNAFMESWSARQMTIHNHELRTRSRKRRATVIAQFDELDELLSDTRGELDRLSDAITPINPSN